MRRISGTRGKRVFVIETTKFEDFPLLLYGHQGLPTQILRGLLSISCLYTLYFRYLVVFLDALFHYESSRCQPFLPLVVHHVYQTSGSPATPQDCPKPEYAATFRRFRSSSILACITNQSATEFPSRISSQQPPPDTNAILLYQPSSRPRSPNTRPTCQHTVSCSRHSSP